MRRLERRDDPLGLADPVEGCQSFSVGRSHVLGTPAVAQPGVLRADARVVEPGRDRVRFPRLTVLVLQEIGTGAVQHTGRATGDRGGDLVALAAYIFGLSQSVAAQRIEPRKPAVRVPWPLPGILPGLALTSTVTLAAFALSSVPRFPAGCGHDIVTWINTDTDDHTVATIVGRAVSGATAGYFIGSTIAMLRQYWKQRRDDL